MKNKTVSDIGEFGFIKQLRKKIKTDASVVQGSGDDCAVLKFNSTHYQLLTCDMLVEGVDFYKNTPARLVGRKALAVSISDIAACCGIPRHAVVSLGLPKNIALARAQDLAQGLIDTAAKFRVNLVGGDISASQNLVIDVSVLGEVEKDKLCLRSGAKAGDLILVTGDFGGSIKGKHLNFQPRLEEARYLAHNFKINAMIDVSDGLLQDLGHILEESRLGAVIYESLVPLSRQAKNAQEALCSGEEFELLFTASRDQASRIIKSSKYRFKLVGEIMPRPFGLRLIDYNNRYAKLKAAGWRHF